MVAKEKAPAYILIPRGLPEAVVERHTLARLSNALFGCCDQYEW